MAASQWGCFAAVLCLSLAACGGGGGPAAALQATGPAITAVAAVSGPTAGQPCVPGGGTEVEVAGAGFVPPVAVEVGGLPAVVTAVTPTAVRFLAPDRDAEGTFAVTVRTGGGGSAVAPAPLAYTWEFSLDPAPETLTLAAAHHLYRRAGFGAAPGQAEAAVRDGLSLTVDRLLGLVDAEVVEAEAAAVYDTFPPRGPVPRRTNQEWWLRLILENPNALQERMAYFWHDHFATSQRDFNDATWLIVGQIELFRAEGRGNFADLCAAVARDPAMLHWLDGVFSTRERPNENFARELWELFLLGEGEGYTEADIREAARAFTGFRLHHGADHLVTVEYEPALHDDGRKTIFGETGNYGYDGVDPRDTAGGVVALTLRRHPAEVARFLCRKLVAEFVYADPPVELVEPLAADLQAAGWELRPVLARMLKSRAFLSVRARRARRKNPLEYAAGLLRATGLDLPTHRLNQRLVDVGFALLEPAQVSGFPPADTFLGGQDLVGLFNFVNEAISYLDTPAQAEPLLPPPGSRTVAERVAVVASLLDVPLTPVAREEMEAYLRAGPDDDVMKTRGLLYLAATYPEAFRK